MKILVSLSGGYGSAYNLWRLAKKPSDDITAVFVDFEYFSAENVRKRIKKQNSNYAEQISEWISTNVRTINFVKLDIDNYEPNYSGIPQLEIVNYANSNQFDKIVFSDDIKDESTPDIILRRAIAKIKPISTEISYPIRETNSTNFQCAELIPDELKLLCASDGMQQKSAILKKNGMSVNEIVAKQIAFARGAFLETTNDWVHSDNEFGYRIFEKNFELYYPQYAKLWKE
jgi:hypothetical protein